MNAPDFDVESLARHLHLSPEVIVRMAERGKLPGRRIGGQWRFSAADVHHWWEDRIGASDLDDLARVEEAFERHEAPAEDYDVTLAGLLALDRIVLELPARTRGSVLKEMVTVAARDGLVWDPERFEEALRTRETLHPTALDNGVALLHPRRPLANVVGEPFLAFGRTPRGIPFGHPRGVLTDLFFLIGAPDDRTHLRILARLSRLLADPAMLDLLRTADDARTLLEALVARDRETYP